jgi:hypothetical protein
VGDALYDDTVVILPRQVAEHLGELYEALGSSTWGEIRTKASAGIYTEILGQAGYGSVAEFMARFGVGRPVPGAAMEGLRALAAKQDEPSPTTTSRSTPSTTSAATATVTSRRRPIF